MVKAQLRISIAKKKYDNKVKTIKIKVTVKNASDSDIMICNIWQPTVNINFKAKLEDKDIEEYKVEGELLSPKKENFVKLKPGAVKSTELNILDYLDLSEPGTYFIEAFYENMYDYYIKKADTLRGEDKKIIQKVDKEIIRSRPIKLIIEED